MHNGRLPVPGLKIMKGMKDQKSMCMLEDPSHPAHVHMLIKSLHSLIVFVYVPHADSNALVRYKGLDVQT